MQSFPQVLKQTGRPGVRKAVVVFANGKTGAEIVDLAKEARVLHGNDVKVVAVGLGDDVSEEEMKAVANAGVILAERDQDSDVIAQNVAKQLDMLSGVTYKKSPLKMSDGTLSYKTVNSIILVLIITICIFALIFRTVLYRLIVQVMDHKYEQQPLLFRAHLRTWVA